MRGKDFFVIVNMVNLTEIGKRMAKFVTERVFPKNDE